MGISRFSHLFLATALTLVAPTAIPQEKPELTEQLQELADRAPFRLRIVGHIEGDGRSLSDIDTPESAIKKLIPKAYGFVVGYGPDHTVASLTVYGTGKDKPMADDLAASNLSQAIERQEGLQGADVIEGLSNTLADRSKPEIRAKLSAIELLSEMPLEAARKSLEQGLGAREPEVRLAAIQAIERANVENAVFLLAQAYHVETNPGVIQHLRSRFARIDHPLATALLNPPGP